MQFRLAMYEARLRQKQSFETAISGISMRRSTLASAGFLALLSRSALAADAGVDLLMTAPGFDWTGYYAGLQAGYGRGSSDISGTEGAPFAASPDLDGGFA